LATALVRLVPASLYRAAEVREAKGDRKQAAAGFEGLVRGHGNFEFADRSLYRAAGLRAAAGDTASAANDYAWLLKSYPKSPLQADALLESGRCREALGEKEVAARAFESFADRYPQHAQARPARLRAGLLFAGSGHAAAADSQYAVVLDEIHPKAAAPRDPALAADLWMRRARLTRAPAAALPHYRRALECGEACPKTDRAEALFKLTEAELPAYQAVTLRQPITESLKRKQKAVETLVGGYRNSAEQQVEPWHAAACLRLGETLADFGSALRHSEPPPELQGEDLFAYQETLNKQAESLDDRAVEAWSRGLAAAHQAKHADGWTKATEGKLYPMLATRVPTRPAPLFVLVQP
jgi:tetratricopeptide (TPR) repeat protein